MSFPVSIRWKTIELRTLRRRELWTNWHPLRFLKKGGMSDAGFTSALRTATLRYS